MKISVCERPDETARREAAWADLVCSPRANPTDVVVLPEMPFCEWQTFRTRKVDFAAVDRARQTYPRNLVIPS